MLSAKSSQLRQIEPSRAVWLEEGVESESVGAALGTNRALHARLPDKALAGNAEGEAASKDSPAAGERGKSLQEKPGLDAHAGSLDVKACVFAKAANA